MIMMQLRRHSIVQHAAHASRSSTSSSSSTTSNTQQQQQQQHGAAATHTALCVLGVHTHELCCTLHIHTLAGSATEAHTLPHTPHTPSLFIRDCSLQPCVLRATVGGKPKKKNGVCRVKGPKLAHCLARLNLPALAPLAPFLSFALHFDCNWSRLSARCISMSWLGPSQASAASYACNNLPLLLPPPMRQKITEGHSLQRVEVSRLLLLLHFAAPALGCC